MTGDEPTLEEMAQAVRQMQWPAPAPANIVRLLYDLSDANWHMVRALAIMNRMQASMERAENVLASHKISYARENEAGTRG